MRQAVIVMLILTVSVIICMRRIFLIVSVLVRHMRLEVSVLGRFFRQFQYVTQIFLTLSVRIKLTPLGRQLIVSVRV